MNRLLSATPACVLASALILACGPKAPPEAAPEVAVETPTSPPEVPGPAILPKASFEQRVADAIALLTTSTPEDASKALQQLQDLAREEPDVPELYYNQGVAYEVMGDVSGARKAYLRSTDVDPTYGYAWLNMGAISEGEGALDRALQNYRAGLRNDPGNSELVSATIGVLRKIGRYDEAERLARQAIKDDANNIGAYNNLGLIYLDQGKLELAQFVYQRAIMAVPGADNSANIHANLGRVFLARDKPGDARVELDKALGIDPQHVTAMVALSQFHLDNRDWNSTAQLLEQAREVAPENPDIRVNLGIAYRGLARHDEAERSYQKALDLEPENLSPYLNLALLYGEHMQLFDKAIETIQRYRDLGGSQLELAGEWEADILKKQKEVARQKEIARKREERRKKREEQQRLLEEEKAREAAAAAEAAAQEAAAPPSGESTPPSDGAPTPAGADEGANAPAPATWGSAEAAPAAPAAPAAASALGTACAALGACGDPALECAHDATCREAGTAGTFGVGVGCVAATDCAVGLACVQNTCAAASPQGAGQENVGGGTANPWGGQ